MDLSLLLPLEWKGSSTSIGMELQMRIIGVAAAITLAAMGAAATAQEAQPEAEQEKKICRTSKMTGSLTRRTRICMTEAEWRELANRTRRGLDELVGGASGAPKCISAMDAACGAPGA